MTLALAGISMPSFWLGPLLAIFFAVYLGWLPVSGSGTALHLVLPAQIAGAGLHRSIGFDEARLDFERRFVRAALARAGGRKSTAAAQLGVSRQGLAKILKRLGIES